jgi:hypothetical protein
MPKSISLLSVSYTSVSFAISTSLTGFGFGSSTTFISSSLSDALKDAADSNDFSKSISIYSFSYSSRASLIAASPWKLLSKDS